MKEYRYKIYFTDDKEPVDVLSVLDPVQNAPAVITKEAGYDWLLDSVDRIEDLRIEEVPAQYPVTDTVQMFAVRKIGKNVPHTTFTYFIEEAETWVTKGCEIVVVHIKPLSEVIK